MTELELTRTISHEYWRGIPVVAYHWTIHDPEHPIEGLRERDGIAYHWSTGPKDAEPLIRVRDASTAIAELQAQVEAMREASIALALKAGVLVCALDGQERYRGKRQAVTDAMNALTAALQPKDQSNGPKGVSACDKCGAEYPSAPAGTIHKCGRCSGGYCNPIGGLGNG